MASPTDLAPNLQSEAFLTPVQTQEEALPPSYQESQASNLAGRVEALEQIAVEFHFQQQRVLADIGDLNQIQQLQDRTLMARIRGLQSQNERLTRRAEVLQGDVHSLQCVTAALALFVGLLSCFQAYYFFS